MFHVVAIADKSMKNLIAPLVERANSAQRDFKFSVSEEIDPGLVRIPKKNLVGEKGCKILYELKAQYNLRDEDLLILLYKGNLSSEDGERNLFSMASGITDSEPGVAIISLKFLQWNILEDKYNDEIKAHAIFHLILWSTIGAYTSLDDHDETLGCIMDYCNNLKDFNEMIGKKYHFCDEKNCFKKIKRERLGDSILAIANELRKEYVKTVLVLGKYSGEGMQRLRETADIVKSLGYQPIISKDVPDKAYHSIERKIINLGSAAHIIVCENTFASGHIDELRLCVENEFITGIVKETGKGATWMQAHYPFYHNYIKVFCYNGDAKANDIVCSKIHPTLKDAVKDAVEWAEKKNKEFEKILTQLYPWR